MYKLSIEFDQTNISYFEHNFNIQNAKIVIISLVHKISQTKKQIIYYVLNNKLLLRIISIVSFFVF